MRELMRPSLRAKLIQQPTFSTLQVVLGVLGAVGAVAGVVALTGVLPTTIGAVALLITVGGLLARARYEDTASKLNGATASALEATERVRRFQGVLDEITQRHSSDYREEIAVSYWIGASAKEDRVRRSHRTTAIGHALLWRTFSTGSASEEGVDLSFGGLEMGVEPSHVADLLPLKEGSSPVRGMAVFVPPIRAGGAARRWDLVYRWPGFWNPLRTVGRDTHRFTARTARDRVTLRFIFPPGTKDVRFRSTPKEGRARRRTYQGSPTLEWTMADVKPGQYQFVLEVPEWG